MTPAELPFADAARLLSPIATERTLRTYRERGLLRAVKIGRIWHTTPEAIEELRALLWQNSSSTGPTQSTGPSSGQGTADTSGTSSGKRKTRRASGMIRMAEMADTLAPRMKQPKTAPRVSTNAAYDPVAPQRGVNAGETERKHRERHALRRQRSQVRILPSAPLSEECATKLRQERSDR